MCRSTSLFNSLLSLVVAAACSAAVPSVAVAQLDSLVALALAEGPAVRAARERLTAARARVAPVAALPDPMLGFGIMNVPITDPGLGDFMTMTTVSAQQRLPYPGKLSLAGRAAEQDARSAEARLRAAEAEAAAAVRREYFELAFIDSTLGVLTRNQGLTGTLGELSEHRYAAATEGQSAVLDVRMTGVDLLTEAAELHEARRAALARLNALLGRPSETPLEDVEIPARIQRLAVPQSEDRLRFTSAAAGVRVVDSPLPPLAELQQRAMANNPLLAAHEAEIDAQTTRLELAEKAHLPDFDLWVQYGQRVDNADMMSVMVSVPVPLRRGARQDQEVAGARADLAALHAEHDAMANELRADVAEHVSDLERSRTQLALLFAAVVPQGRAVIESSVAAYRAGSATLADVIESRVALFQYEIAYLRTLSDFAIQLADLEKTVGEELVP